MNARRRTRRGGAVSGLSILRKLSISSFSCSHRFEIFPVLKFYWSRAPSSLSSTSSSPTDFDPKHSDSVLPVELRSSIFGFLWIVGIWGGWTDIGDGGGVANLGIWWDDSCDWWWCLLLHLLFLVVIVGGGGVVVVRGRRWWGWERKNKKKRLKMKILLSGFWSGVGDWRRMMNNVFNLDLD